MSCIKPNTHVHCLRFPDFNNWLLRFIDGRVNSCFWNILALILCFQILALNSGFQTLALIFVFKYWLSIQVFKHIGSHFMFSNIGSQFRFSNIGSHFMFSNIGSQFMFSNILALILCFQILALNSGFQTLALNSGFQTLALNSGFKTLALILCSSKYFYISACWEERIPPRTKVARVSLNTITQLLSSATAFLSLVFVFHSTFTSSAVLLPVLVPWLSSNTNW